MLAAPDRGWRIIRSPKHSSVWDGEETLFDFNGQALFKDADLAFDHAFEEEFPPGAYRATYFAEHIQVVAERSRRGVAKGLCPWCGEVWQLPSCCSEYAKYELPEGGG
jgi:hypothetical protein